MYKKIAIVLLCTSCAGPMSPFGARTLFEPFTKITTFDGQENITTSERGPAAISEDSELPIKIHFSPERLKLHDRSKLKIMINDPDGIDVHHSVRFFYNGIEVSDSFEKLSKKSVSNNKILYELDDFRLIPDRNNNIVVGYRRSPISPIIYKKYQDPVCHWRDEATIKNSSDFEDKMDTLKIVENISLIQGVNPNFIAGLVAQESSFNPNAVSIAKAIGLTQVTSLAEEHVLLEHPEWPSYEGIKNYPVPVIKGLIITGQINDQNEWRLNPKFSIRGGIQYMEFIENYWNREENKIIVEKHLGPFELFKSDILLASYNSGPYRVKVSIIKSKKKWLASRKLREARKYVNRVKSYCYHFSKEFDENQI